MKLMHTTSMLATAIITAATMSATPAVSAQDSDRLSDEPQAQSATVNRVDPSLVEKADKYVIADGNGLMFDADDAKELNASEKNQVKAAVDEWNRNLRLSEAPTQTDVKKVDAQKATVVKGKHGYIEAHWWGLKIHVDSYLKGKIQSGAVTAAAIAQAIGLASSSTGVGGVAGTVVAVALGGAAGIIGLCSEKDGGVTFYQAITGGAPVCNPIA